MEIVNATSPHLYFIIYEVSWKPIVVIFASGDDFMQ